MNKKNNNLLDSNLENLEAYINAIEQGADVGLSQLEGKNDPNSIRRKLEILIHAERFHEAVNIIKDREPHEQWAEKAIVALVKNNNIEEAKRIVYWSKNLDNIIIWHRCALIFAEFYKQNILKNYLLCFPGNLLETEEKKLQEVLDVLRPIIIQVKAKERINTELESLAVQHAININWLLINKNESRNLAELLTTRKPIPLELAEIVLRGVIEAPSDLPQRLREEYPKEHPKYISAYTMAAAVEGKLFDPEDGFVSAKKLITDLRSSEEKEQICKLLNEFAFEVGIEAIINVDEIVPPLLEHNPKLNGLLKADRLRFKDELDAAIIILDEVRDEKDPYWLQVYADCLLQKKDGNTAIDMLLKASSILPHPIIYKRIASIAYEYKRLDVCLDALNQLLLLDPENINAHINIASLYIDKGDFNNAARHYKISCELEPDDILHSVNFARCLANAGNQKEALKVYESICSKDNSPLEAYLGRAELLKILNSPKEAFNSLKIAQDKYWDDPNFLVVFLNLGYAANEEKDSHRAFLQILKLQENGQVEQVILQKKTSEEVKEYFAHSKEHRESILQNFLVGKLPWLCVDELLGKVSYSGWRARTQSMNWLYDDPLFRAEYSIYSTNSFRTLLKEKNTAPYLEFIQCPPSGTDIAIDLSALITLHQLKLLDKLVEYFGKVFVPSEYLSHALDVSSKLIVHQLSQKTFFEKAKTALDNGKIQVLEGEKISNKTVAYVNEHDPDNQKNKHCYRLIDVVSVLYNNGKITDTKYEEIMSINHQTSGVDTNHPQLEIAQPILFELITLTTFSQFDLLDMVIECFEVYVTPKERDEITYSVSTIIVQEEVKIWHEELWSILRKDARFIQVPNKKLMQDISLVAFQLAQQREVSLLVDDRACQAMSCNENLHDQYASFGADCLLLALGRSALLDKNEVADKLLQLIRWRYKFIIFPPEVLKTLADRFRKHPPGQSLREVARYVHDCMRDPGLFGGFEKTKPPTTIANRLFQTWVSNIASFIMKVWIDSSFDDGNAKKLTNWAIKEFLPSPPQSMGEGRMVIASLTNRIVIHAAMIQSTLTTNSEKAKKGLDAIADALNLSQQEYLKIVTGILDVT